MQKSCSVCDKIREIIKNLLLRKIREKVFFIPIRRFFMAKAGMRRPDPSEPHGTESNKKNKFPKNRVEPVPEISGAAKSGKKKANPM